MTVIERVPGPDCCCSGPKPSLDLITIDEALTRVVGTAARVSQTETVSLAHALDRVVAEQVHARTEAPLFDNAAMDGFALNAQELSGRGPWTLDVGGYVAAGQSSDTLPEGKSVRILTGAPVPRGADTVIAQENVARHGNTITFDVRPKTGQHVRKAGKDFRSGDSVVAQGCRLGPRQIAICAAAGQTNVEVLRRPRVALVTTGNELCTDGQIHRSGQIWDVNTPMIAAAITASTGRAPTMSHTPDTREHVENAFAEFCSNCDLVVTTGGVSDGDADYLRPVFESLGGEFVFAGVAMKPGKPVTFGRLNGALWLGLPGNPLSAFVTWTLFGRPILDALCGHTSNGNHRRMVHVGEDVTHRAGRAELRLARLVESTTSGQDTVICDTATHSGHVSSLSAVDGLVVIPAEITTIPAGTPVEFLEFSS